MIRVIKAFKVIFDKYKDDNKKLINKTKEYNTLIELQKFNYSMELKEDIETEFNKNIFNKYQAFWTTIKTR